MPDRAVEESRTPLAGNDESAPKAESNLARPSDHATPTVGVLERLRHHKVAQWTLAYAAGAYTLLHAVEMISGALGWPHLVVRLTTLVLLLGVPVVITLAWFHGYRARQRVGGVELAILTVLFAAAGGVLWFMGRPDGAMTASVHRVAGEPSPGVGAKSGLSIAVLPFENRSKTEGDAFFAAGVHDEIMDQLSRLGGVKVISATSVERYRGTSLPSREIAEQLGVRHLVEGGVQRSGSRVRVQLRLIDAPTDAQVWSDSFDRELTVENIFVIQTEIARSVAAALDVRASRSESSLHGRAPTTNMAAWENYQHGRQEMRRGTGDGALNAERYFQQAVDLDPGFAVAHAYLAISQLEQLGVVAEGVEISRKEALSRAKPAAETALRLDPDLPEVLAAAGLVKSYERSLLEAERLLRRAIGLNPNYSEAYEWLINLLKVDANRLAEAEMAARQFVQLNPTVPQAYELLGDILWSQNKSGAEQAYLEAIRFDPLRPIPYVALGGLRGYGRSGNLVDGILLLRKAIALDPAQNWYLAHLCRMYSDLGETELAKRTFDTWLKNWHETEAYGRMAIFEEGEVESPAGWAVAERLLENGGRSHSALRVLRDRDLSRGHPEAALERYAKAYPELTAAPVPRVDEENRHSALYLVLVLRATGDTSRAELLLRGVQSLMNAIPPRERGGVGEAQLLLLSGDEAGALRALRKAASNNFRWEWRYYRDALPEFAPLRGKPEFKAIFAEIEREVERQRAEFDRLPEDAEPDLTRIYADQS